MKLLHMCKELQVPIAATVQTIDRLNQSMQIEPREMTRKALDESKVLANPKFIHTSIQLIFKF